MQFDKNLIAFKVVLPNGMLIQEFERRQNKTYVTILPTLSTKDQNGNDVYQNLSFIPCDDPDLQDYYCVDFSNVNSNKVNQPFLTYYPYDNQKQKLEVLMLYCTSELSYPGIVCATHEETQKEIINFKTQVYTRVTSQQYNPTTRSFEKKIKLEQFYLSDTLVFLGKFSLKSTTTTINDGFIIQKQSSYTYISDYSKTNEYSTFTFQKAQNNLDMIGACFFYLDENGRNEFVQFVQFPSILAQFMSIFNSLLVVGVICKQFSQSEMIQDFMEIQLKNYYKKSAIEFMHEVETKKQSNSISNYFQNNLMQTYKQICNMDYKYYMKQFLDTTLYNKIKLLIFSKGGKTKTNDPKQVKMYKRLMDSTIEQINIYDIQKEILKLKMMVRMSFTVEQYAALQLCGLRIILDENIPNVEESILENIQMKEDLFKSSEEEGIKQKKEQSIEMELKLKENEVQVKLQEYQLNQIEQSVQKQQKQNQDNYLTENAENQERENIQHEENNLSKPQEKQNTKVEFEDNIFKLDEKNDQKFKKLNFKSIALNHLEKIERLERDNTYFEQKIDQFFNQKKFKTQLDQRILDCLIGYKQYKLDTQSFIPITKSCTINK
ncbi:phosphatidylserine decarboxylase family protein, putative (macronuclear) [Tetrahymena thermophila SB210]|uniref:Phosphatidylserine decarboxylase family protein, putative n=1 Tax=Tetrahymena thermophila (strain SB210) TaxID=312017 RepID=I7M6S6_TETTS|nr:phosphatidylserine decarboxylase family protein, putative [Tetrahymena thermophila SB210]EAR86039.2 phosphatidylserine decarboxylase family protein, putative [Tetrahymena thermophila SB210]|eukprot:XP_976634.2 phosphatidylserine decarboxylase family protein, putative [Tetrahymena thermophila SB210]